MNCKYIIFLALLHYPYPHTGVPLNALLLASVSSHYTNIVTFCMVSRYMCEREWNRGIPHSCSIIVWYTYVCSLCPTLLWFGFIHHLVYIKPKMLLWSHFRYLICQCGSGRNRTPVHKGMRKRYSMLHCVYELICATR